MVVVVDLQIFSCAHVVGLPVSRRWWWSRSWRWWWPNRPPLALPLPLPLRLPLPLPPSLLNFILLMVVAHVLEFRIVELPVRLLSGVCARVSDECEWRWYGLLSASYRKVGPHIKL